MTPFVVLAGAGAVLGAQSEPAMAADFALYYGFAGGFAGAVFGAVLLGRRVDRNVAARTVNL